QILQLELVCTSFQYPTRGGPVPLQMLQELLLEGITRPWIGGVAEIHDGQRGDPEQQCRIDILEVNRVDFLILDQGVAPIIPIRVQPQQPWRVLVPAVHLTLRRFDAPLGDWHLTRWWRWLMRVPPQWPLIGRIDRQQRVQ